MLPRRRTKGPLTPSQTERSSPTHGVLPQRRTKVHSHRVKQSCYLLHTVCYHDGELRVHSHRVKQSSNLLHTVCYHDGELRVHSHRVKQSSNLLHTVCYHDRELRVHSHRVKQSGHLLHTVCHHDRTKGPLTPSQTERSSPTHGVLP